MARLKTAIHQNLLTGRARWCGRGPGGWRWRRSTGHRCQRWRHGHKPRCGRGSDEINGRGGWCRGVGYHKGRRRGRNKPRGGRGRYKGRGYRGGWSVRHHDWGRGGSDHVGSGRGRRRRRWNRCWRRGRGWRPATSAQLQAHVVNIHRGDAPLSIVVHIEINPNLHPHIFAQIKLQSLPGPRIAYRRPNPLQRLPRSVHDDQFLGVIPIIRDTHGIDMRAQSQQAAHGHHHLLLHRGITALVGPCQNAQESATVRTSITIRDISRPSRCIPKHPSLTRLHIPIHQQFRARQRALLSRAQGRSDGTGMQEKSQR